MMMMIMKMMDDDNDNILATPKSSQIRQL
jgi:hypothetical protein